MVRLAVTVISLVIGTAVARDFQQVQSAPAITAIAFDSTGRLAVAYGISNDDPCGAEFDPPIDTHIKLLDVNFDEIGEIPTNCTAGSLEFSANDAFIYYTSYSGHNGVWDIVNENYESRSYTGGLSTLGVYWSEDEEYIELSHSFIRIFDTSEALQELFYEASDFHTNIFVDADISASGEKIVSAGDDNIVKVWHTLSTEITVVYDNHQALITDVRWSNSDAKIASGDASGTIAIWSAIDGQKLLTLPSPNTQINVLAWSPDDTRLASASQDGLIKVWNAESGELVQTMLYTGAVYALDWCRSGEQIVYGGTDLSGNPPQIEIRDAPMVSARIHPRGCRLACAAARMTTPQ